MSCPGPPGQVAAMAKRPLQLGRPAPMPASPDRATLDRVANPHPDTDYVARFTAPEFTAKFVACFEIACGCLVLLGLLTRLAVIPLITIMLVAIATTKIPILQEQGFWKMAHEARTDWSMLLGSVFLLIVGAGSLSIDAWLTRRRDRGGVSNP